MTELAKAFKEYLVCMNSKSGDEVFASANAFLTARDRLIKEPVPLNLLAMVEMGKIYAQSYQTLDDCFIAAKAKGVFNLLFFEGTNNIPADVAGAFAQGYAMEHKLITFGESGTVTLRGGGKWPMRETADDYDY